jgi:hypothetical protein
MPLATLNFLLKGEDECEWEENGRTDNEDNENDEVPVAITKSTSVLSDMPKSCVVQRREGES